jgi:triosephosphate isomerase (TIM)
MRTSLIAGNWKMNLDAERALALVEGIVAAIPTLPRCKLAVFPPFVYIAESARAAAWSGGRLAIGAQNCHAADSGAHTGEVSAAMLRDVGATTVILGHSERRRDCQECDGVVSKKLRAALRQGLEAIVCVGETLEQRDAGQTLDVVRSQVAQSLGDIEGAAFARTAIAYEPVWAIGTGRTATPAQAVEVHAVIRETLAERYGQAVAASTRILYGGSVTAENAATLLKEPEIDGALVGGASLSLDSFLRIVRAARA